MWVLIFAAICVVIAGLSFTALVLLLAGAAILGGIARLLRWVSTR